MSRVGVAHAVCSLTLGTLGGGKRPTVTSAEHPVCAIFETNGARVGGHVPFLALRAAQQHTVWRVVSQYTLLWPGIGVRAK
jgi:hypothetical protein